MRDQERNWISQHQRSAFTKTFRNFALACWIRGMNDESIDVNISFINTDYFSVSVRDGSISVIGRITKLEMEKFVKAQYFKIKEVLDKNSKEGGNHD